MGQNVNTKLKHIEKKNKVLEDKLNSLRSDVICMKEKMKLFLMENYSSSENSVTTKTKTSIVNNNGSNSIDSNELFEKLSDWKIKHACSSKEKIYPQ